MKEKITLTKEQEEKFVNEFMNGEIFGLKELMKILKEEIKIQDKDNKYSIYDLIEDTIGINSIYVYGCEDTNGLGEFEKEIKDLYDKLKVKLFNSFTNDFKI